MCRVPDTPEQLSNRATNAPLLRYADALRTHGHRAASIDPLGLLQRERVAALEPSRYGLLDLDATYDINGILWTAGTQAPGKLWALRDIADFLNAAYVGQIAYEYMDLPSKTERLWFSHLLESQSNLSAQDCSPTRKQRIHELLACSEVFDTFLQSKFPNLKRYGLEGGESMLPALDALIREAAQGAHIFLESILFDTYLGISGYNPHHSCNAASWPIESPHRTARIRLCSALSQNKGWKGTVGQRRTNQWGRS